MTSTAASVGPYRLCSSRARQPRAEALAPAPAAAPRRCTSTRRSARQRAPAAGASRNALQHATGTKCSVGDAARARDRLRQVRRVAVPVRARQHQPRAGAAAARRAPSTETSKLNGVFCSTASSAPSADAVAASSSSRLHDAAVRDHHALGPAGRAGGVDDVGQVLRRQPPRAGFVAGARPTRVRVARPAQHRRAVRAAARAAQRAPASAAPARRAVRQHEAPAARPGTPGRAARTRRPP